MEMLKGLMNVFAHLTKYSEVFKTCSSEACTICDGLWWNRGRAQPGARMESPGGAVAAKVVAAGLGKFNLHCKGFYSVLFAFLNILYYFSVNLNSSYIFRARVYAVNFLLPWGF